MHLPAARLKKRTRLFLKKAAKNALHEEIRRRIRRNSEQPGTRAIPVKTGKDSKTTIARETGEDGEDGAVDKDAAREAPETIVQPVEMRTRPVRTERETRPHHLTATDLRMIVMRRSRHRVARALAATRDPGRSAIAATQESHASPCHLFKSKKA